MRRRHLRSRDEERHLDALDEARERLHHARQEHMDALDELEDPNPWDRKARSRPVAKTRNFTGREGEEVAGDNPTNLYGAAKSNQLGPCGKHHHSLCPFGIFDAKDGGVAIAAPMPAQWEILCQEMGRPELVDDERTKDFAARRKNREFVEGVVSEWTGALTRDQVVEALGGKVPCGPVQTAADIFESPHTAVREMVAEVELPGDNEPVRIVGSPIKYTETKTGVRSRAPLLDEHREEILAEFGINAGLDQEDPPKEQEPCD